MLNLLNFAAGCFYFGLGRSRKFIRFNGKRTVDFTVARILIGLFSGFNNAGCLKDFRGHFTAGLKLVEIADADGAVFHPENVGKTAFAGQAS